MKTVEIKTKNELFDIIVPRYRKTDDLSVLPPMYHGTDMSLVNASKEERDHIKKICDNVISHLYEYYIEKGINKDKRLITCRDSYGSTATALSMVGGRLAKNPLYRYGDFYIANNPGRVINYSKESWIYGETGWIANRLYEGLLLLNEDLPCNESYKEDLNEFIERRSNKKDPIVLILNDLPQISVKTEGGKPIFDIFVKSMYECDVSGSYKLSSDFPLEDFEVYYLKEENYSFLTDIYSNELGGTLWF